MDSDYNNDVNRFLRFSFSYFWGNATDDSNSTDFDSNLQPPQDVSVDAVVTSLYFNTFIFIILMASYECLRRLFPAVYSSRKRLDHTGTSTRNGNRAHAMNQQDQTLAEEEVEDARARRIDESMDTLPDDQPLDWIQPVFFGVPWPTVRKTAGLDGYFFLRYIRMNVRITAVSTFWFFLTLVPIYATGGSPNNNAQGWYHLSAANVHKDSWRMWAPVVLAYIFSGFICFVIKQEYRHFLELRQDFLARGSAHVHPQHHYSLMLENIPYELRSERALNEYFEKLFPGKVHSASIVLNLPDLEEASMRCMRTCRRLEKSIAHLHATKRRPTHIVGRGRCSMLGVDLQPVDLNCMSDPDVLYLPDELPILEDRVKRGTRVDSITYYTHELAAHSRILFELQQRKVSIAESGNEAVRAEYWFSQAAQFASQAADQIMDDSALDNELMAPSTSYNLAYPEGPQAENMTSRYGSFAPFGTSDRGSHRANWAMPGQDDKKSSLIQDDHLNGEDPSVVDFATPFSKDQYGSAIRRMAGRLGLDFVVAGLRFFNKQLDVTLEGVLGTTMSSTGFVTFLDLTSTTCAASAPLTVKANVLNVSIAPEPREILWENAQVSQVTQKRREHFANVFLALGVILWSFPLAAIQLFAKAQYLAQIPGMGWIIEWHGGKLTSFVNGYLPVVALLTLILILPLIFEYVAVKYERRKTTSEVQTLMLSRYFYYQLANIYVSVTAGSILKSLKDILDHPSNIVQLLGESLPTMVGYFIALLVTKILAGLPMIFLRLGALSRMLFLRTLAKEKKLTQRELDAVYRQENMQYGWEFPSQMLVVVVVFTYAIICPVILPVGLTYFVGALIVYKKQILYVYTPVYESGGAMFPVAVQRTLFGLICGQMTLLGYIIIRGCYYQPVFLLPLPLVTVWTMNYFEKTYAEPSTRLSLERAREYDRLSANAASRVMHGLDSAAVADPGIEQRRTEFDADSYRQPLLTEAAAEPWTYRRGQNDRETVAVQTHLRQINRHISKASETHDARINDLPAPT